MADLAKDSMSMWRDLERDSNEELVLRTGDVTAAMLQTVYVRSSWSYQAEGGLQRVIFVWQVC